MVSPSKVPLVIHILLPSIVKWEPLAAFVALVVMPSTSVPVKAEQ